MLPRFNFWVKHGVGCIHKEFVLLPIGIVVGVLHVHKQKYFSITQSARGRPMHPRLYQRLKVRARVYPLLFFILFCPPPLLCKMGEISSDQANHRVMHVLSISNCTSKSWCDLIQPSSLLTVNFNDMSMSCILVIYFERNIHFMYI